MKRLLCAAFFVILSLAPLSHAEAAQIQIPLQVTPAKVSTTLTPGKLLVGEVEFINASSTQSFDLTTSVQDLQMTGLAGEFTYNQNSSPLAFHNYIRLSDQSFHLGPTEAKKIEYEVLLPKSAPPGGYYGVIFAKTAARSFEGTGVAISGQVGTLLLFQVVGEAEDRGEVTAFQPHSKQGSSSPASFSLTLKNRGHIDGTPRGIITQATGEILITNWYGKKVATLPIPATYILPDASRQINLSWKPSSPGLYHATAKVAFNSHPVIVKGSHLWYLPQIAVIITGLIILMIAFLFFRFRRVVLRRKKS
jgi:hypothetical protein